MFPFFKKTFKNKNSNSLILEQINNSPILIRLGLLVANITVVLLGRKSNLIPILNKITIPFLAIVDMHAANTNPYYFEGRGRLNCNFTKISFDEIVVGSGPGGSIAASESLKNGNTVLLVESGNYTNPKIFQHSPEQLVNNFAGGGLEVILGPKIIPFAQGKAVGGGSQVNSGLYHKIPEKIRRQWLNILGASEYEWGDCEKIIEELIHVQTQAVESLGVYSRSPILDMAKYLNWECKIVPRWRKYQTNSYLHFGMNETIIRSAVQNGLNLLPNHFITRIKIKNGKVFVIVFGDHCKHKLQSKYLTLSAGSIETPRILLKSKLIKSKMVKINFHAMTRLVAIFKDKINDGRDIDPHQAWPKDFSAKIGSAVSTPTLLAATKTNMSIEFNSEIEKTGVYYVSTVPSGKSRFINLIGIYMPVFAISRSSMLDIEKNTKLLKESLIHAGAEKVFGDTVNPSITSVHIFGSLPIGGTDIVDINGFVRGTNKLIRVSDGSILPTAPIVNPQGPISVLSLLLARRIHKTEWRN